MPFQPPCIKTGSAIAPACPPAQALTDSAGALMTRSAIATLPPWARSVPSSRQRIPGPTAGAVQ